MARFCILGWGRTGKSTACYLRDHYFHNKSFQENNFDQKAFSNNSLHKAMDYAPLNNWCRTPNEVNPHAPINSNVQETSKNDNLIAKHTLHGIVVWDDYAQTRAAVEKDGFTVLPDNFQWHGVTLIVSPGIGKHFILDRARSQGCRIISDIQLFNDLFPNTPTIGVTGSNGKTTTCSLIAHGFKKHRVPCVLAGNIGVPIFSTLTPQGQPASGVYILELSSYQLEYSPCLKIDVAIILNLFPHHLERHETMEFYQAIKETILRGAKRGWIPEQWPIVSEFLFDRNLKLEPYPLTSKEFITQNSHHISLLHRSSMCYAVRTDDNVEKGVEENNAEKYTKKSVQFLHHWSEKMVDDYILSKCLKIKHNKSNAAAALAALWTFGCYEKDVFQDFESVEHRQEIVLCDQAVVYCNDSKATNPHAVLHALEAFCDGLIFWIAGGVLQNDDLSVLDSMAKHITHGFCIGQARYRYAQWLKEHNRPATVCDSLEEALQNAQKMALKMMVHVLSDHPNFQTDALVQKNPTKNSSDNISDTIEENLEKGPMQNKSIPSFQINPNQNSIFPEEVLTKPNVCDNATTEHQLNYSNVNDYLDDILMSDISKRVATVLFSPGCASFDQFRDFEHRGQVFKDCVHKYCTKNTDSLENPMQSAMQNSVVLDAALHKTVSTPECLGEDTGLLNWDQTAVTKILKENSLEGDRHSGADYPIDGAHTTADFVNPVDARERNTIREKNTPDKKENFILSKMDNKTNWKP